MFRGMRRFKQQLPEEIAVEILQSADSGILAVLDEEGYPYTVPMSYIYANGKIYFHSAPTGHKIDAIKNYEKASFCIVSKDDVMPEKFSTMYRSIVAFGKLRFIEDREEMRRITSDLAMKYSAEYKEMIPKRIDDAIHRMAIIEMEIEHLTGKESMELARERNEK